MTFYSNIFNEAVAEGRTLYRRETRRITFIDLSLPDAPRQVEGWFARCHPALKKCLATEKDLSPHKLAVITLGETAAAFSDLRGRRKLVVLHPEKVAKAFKTMAPRESIRKTFFHELGHAAVDNALPDFMRDGQSHTSHQEIAADVFMALNLLRQGETSPQMLEEFLLHRAKSLFDNSYQGLSHMTAAALGNVILMAEDTDFTSLTRKQIKSISKEHARKFGKSKKEVLDAGYAFTQADFLPKSPEQTLQGLAAICAQAPADSLEFYAAAVILKACFKNRDDMTGPAWDKTREIIEKKACKIGAEKILPPLPAKKPEIKIINTGLQSTWSAG